MNAAQALAIAAAAYALTMEEPLHLPFELAQSCLDAAVERLDGLGGAFEDASGLRAIPDGGCIERWAAM